MALTENMKRVADSYRRGPAHQRSLIERWLLPQYEDRREEWLQVLEWVDAMLQALPDEETVALYRRDKQPDWYREYRQLSSEIMEACNHYLRKEVLVDGAFYRVRCRNAHCGIWREEEQGFEIPRVKFDHLYLFVEYHHDNGPPYGTVFPYERLEDIPAEIAEDPSRRLEYMQTRNAEIRLEDEKRFEMKLSAWEPLP